MDSVVIDFFKYIWPVLSLPIMWLIKQVGDLKKEHYETKVHAAETYVPRSDYREDIKTLHLKLDAHAAKQDAQFAKILERLDRKQDK